MDKKINIEINKTNTIEEIAKKEQEIRNLQSKLTSVVSNIGGWKIAKCMEYQAMGMDAPYDIGKLHEQRQAVRDKIGEIENEIEKLKNTSDSETINEI